MQLIDKKKAMNHIESQYHQWGDDYDILQAIGDLEDMEPVDTIPIDWILNYSETIVNPKASTFVVNGLISDGIKKMVVLYLKQMKKEQNNGD